MACDQAAWDRPLIVRPVSLQGAWGLEIVMLTPPPPPQVLPLFHFWNYLTQIPECDRVFKREQGRRESHLPGLAQRSLLGGQGQPHRRSQDTALLGEMPVPPTNCANPIWLAELCKDPGLAVRVGSLPVKLQPRARDVLENWL